MGLEFITKIYHNYEWKKYLSDTFPESPIEKYYVNEEVELIVSADDPKNFFLRDRDGNTEQIPEIATKKVNQHHERAFLQSPSLPAEEGIHIPHLGLFVRPPSNQLIPNDQLGSRNLLLNMNDESRQTFNDCYHNALHLAHYDSRFKEDSINISRMSNLFLLLAERIAFEAPYMVNGKQKDRDREINPSTGGKSTQFEHIALVGNNSHCNLYQYMEKGKNKEQISKLKSAEKVLGVKETSSVTLLAGFLHDAIEDFNGSLEEKRVKIHGILKEHKLLNLEKYVIPLVKMLTHEKDEGDSTPMYLDKMENPNNEIFGEYDPSDEEKEALRTLAIHIKCMGDLAHNLETPQSKKAMDTKFAHYVFFIKKYYRDFEDFINIHPSVKVNIEKLERDNVLPENFEPDFRKYEKEPIEVVVHPSLV